MQLFLSSSILLFIFLCAFFLSLSFSSAFQTKEKKAVWYNPPTRRQFFFQKRRNQRLALRPLRQLAACNQSPRPPVKNKSELWPHSCVLIYSHCKYLWLPSPKPPCLQCLVHAAMRIHRRLLQHQTVPVLYTFFFFQNLFSLVCACGEKNY